MWQKNRSVQIQRTAVFFASVSGVQPFERARTSSTWRMPTLVQPVLRDRSHVATAVVGRSTTRDRAQWSCTCGRRWAQEMPAGGVSSCQGVFAHQGCTACRDALLRHPVYARGGATCEECSRLGQADDFAVCVVCGVELCDVCFDTTYRTIVLCTPCHVAALAGDIQLTEEFE